MSPIFGSEMIGGPDPELVLLEWRAAIDRAILRVAPPSTGDNPRLRQAIRYALTGGGKRLRGMLLLAAYQASGGGHDASALAAAVEVVHAYSLVHDDLPCMDDDDLRRGRATTHRAFDVPTATVAGVAMVPIAVSATLLGARELALGEATTRGLVRELMRASGAGGMVGGQLRDLEAEGRQLTLGELEQVHNGKTGTLIAASLVLGGLAAGLDGASTAALRSAGAALGLAFQIADDILDATASPADVGKTTRRDAAMAKSTYVALMGVDGAQGRGEALVARAMSELDRAGLRTPMLEELAHFVAARRS